MDALDHSEDGGDIHPKKAATPSSSIAWDKQDAFGGITKHQLDVIDLLRYHTSVA